MLTMLCYYLEKKILMIYKALSLYSWYKLKQMINICQIIPTKYNLIYYYWFKESSRFKTYDSF